MKHYLNLRPIIVPHTGGKHQHKKFWKTEHVSVIERFLNKIMSPGLISKRIKGRGASHNMGKKQKLLKILYNAFSIIETKTGENPIQILVRAIEKRGTTGKKLPEFPWEEFLTNKPSISLLNVRVDLAIKIIIQSVVGLSYNNIRTIDETISQRIDFSRSE